jgi:phospholipase/carboxylesterase
MPSTGRVIPDMNVLRERRLPMLWQWAQDSEGFDSDRLKQDISVAMSVRAEVEIRQYCDDNEMNTLVLSDVNHWIMNRIVAGNPQSADAGRGWETHETSFSGNYVNTAFWAVRREPFSVPADRDDVNHHAAYAKPRLGRYNF